MSVDIHISNYETFLYSYVDGELDAETTVALETFLDVHPHIRQELELLMATRLTPDAVVFDAKASLYRGSEIQLHNYEPFLLRYIDGELNVQEAAAVEQFVAAHPAVQKELAIWQATRLVADTTVLFENKAVLYRHTKVRAMRPAYWWAAAAVVAGAVLFIRLADQETPQAPVVAENTTPGKVVEPAEKAVAPEGKTPEKAVTAEKTAPDAPVAQTAPLIAAKTATPRPAPAKKETLPAAGKAEQPTVPPAAVDLASISTEAPADPAPRTVTAALPDAIRQVPGNETVATAIKRPSVEPQPEVALATAPPAANPPGELIMSVTGNGIEGRVLDKVTNVARLFSRKKNK